jgi:hypothetical protein
MTGLTIPPESCNNCDGHKAEITGESERLEGRNDRNDQNNQNVYLSRRVEYGRIVMPERVVFDHRPPLHGRVQSLRGMPLVSFFTRAHNDTLFCAAGG